MADTSTSPAHVTARGADTMHNSRRQDPGARLAAEARIEAAIERAMDRLDRRYLTGRLTTSEYDAACASLDREHATAR